MFLILILYISLQYLILFFSIIDTNNLLNIWLNISSLNWSIDEYSLLSDGGGGNNEPGGNPNNAGGGEVELGHRD
jgi:hypothetical protein